MIMLDPSAFSHDGSKIVSVSEDETIRGWDANTGIELLIDNAASMPPLDCQIISLDRDGWFRNLADGCCLGRLPVGSSYYNGQTQRNYYVGWTVQHELVILSPPCLCPLNMSFYCAFNQMIYCHTRFFLCGV